MHILIIIDQYNTLAQSISSLTFIPLIAINILKMDGLEQMVHQTLTHTNYPSTAEIQHKYRQSKQNQNKYQFPRSINYNNNINNNSNSQAQNAIIKNNGKKQSITSTHSLRQIQESLKQSMNYYDLYWQNRNARRNYQKNGFKINAQSGHENKIGQHTEYNKTKILNLNEIHKYISKKCEINTKQKIKITNNLNATNKNNAQNIKQQQQHNLTYNKSPTTTIQQNITSDYLRTPIQISQTPTRSMIKSYKNSQSTKKSVKKIKIFSAQKNKQYHHHHQQQQQQQQYRYRQYYSNNNSGRQSFINRQVSKFREQKQQNGTLINLKNTRNHNYQSITRSRKGIFLYSKEKQKQKFKTYSGDKSIHKLQSKSKSKSKSKQKQKQTQNYKNISSITPIKTIQIY